MAGQNKAAKNKPTPATQSKRLLPWKRIYVLVICIFSLGLYVNTTFNDYNLDDELVTKNHRVTSKGWDVLKFNFDAFNSVELRDSSFGVKLKYFLPVVFRVPYYQDKAGFKYEYRPLVFASFALEHALFATRDETGQYEFRDNPLPGHLINIVLYAALCALLFYILCALFKDYNIVFPFIVTLLFASFPMHTEVVASIKNRDEIMALIFGLLSLHYALVYSEKNRPVSLVLILLFFLAGILSKPTTIIFALLIPLCLVFFTNSGYLKLLLIAGVLIIPSVLFSRLYSIVQQVELGIVLVSAVSALYFLKDPSASWTAIQTAFAESYGYLARTSEAVKTDHKELDFAFLKNPFTFALVVLAAVVPVGLSAFGIYIFNSWLACIPLLLFVFLYMVVRDELKVIFITSFSVLALFAMLRFQHESRPLEIALMIFLSVQIFSGQRSFRITGLANYIPFIIISIVFLHSFHFLFILLFIGLLNRKLVLITWILLALSAVFYFKKLFGLFHGHSWVDGFTLLPIVYVFVYWLWKGWWKRAVLASSVLIPLFVVVYFVWIHPATNNSVYYAVQRTYYRVNSFKAADPTPVQSMRPLKFLEYPINRTDPFSLKFGTDLEVLGNYLKMIIVPYPMSYYYGYAYITPQYIYQAIPLISLLAHLALLAVAIFFFRKKPVLSFSVLFYLISIAVFSNLVTPIPGMLGDRFLLIPSIGFCILVLYLLSVLFKLDFKDSRLNITSLTTPLKVSLGILLVLYSGITFSRNQDWKDSLTLFRHDIKVVDNSAQAHNLLGVHLFLTASKEKDAAVQKQLREEAIPNFKKALEIYPDFLNASYDLGRTYEALRMNDEAFAQFQSTVKLDTTFVAPYFNMGAILHNKGNYEAAIPMYRKFLTQYPKQIEAYTNLSFAYFKLNDFEKSIAVNREAIQATGEPFFPTVNIAKTYMVMNMPDSALVYWEQAHAMKPNEATVNKSIEQLKARKQ